MNINISGKMALVTGGGVGIGRSVASMLAQAGAKVVVTYFKSAQGAEELVASIQKAGGQAAACKANLSNLDELEKLVQEAESKMGGKIDILVNNAGGLIERRSCEDMTEELYQEVLDVNLKSAVFLSKAVLPGMKSRGGGRIINVTSLAAHNGGGAGSAIYAASKAAMMAYTKAMAKETASSNIRVNNVSPGLIGKTPFHDTFTSDEARKAIVKTIPLGREGVPDDVAGAVLYLASDLSSFITGETIEINGGAFMR